MKSFKIYILPLILLWLFLYPLIVKELHVHESHFHCSAKSEKHFHDYHEKCAICMFHFSYFTGHYKYYIPFIKQTFEELVIPFKTIYIKKLKHFLNLLRAPPLALL